MNSDSSKIKTFFPWFTSHLIFKRRILLFTKLFLIIQKIYLNLLICYLFIYFVCYEWQLFKSFSFCYLYISHSHTFTNVTKHNSMYKLYQQIIFKKNMRNMDLTLGKQRSGNYIFISITWSVTVSIFLNSLNLFLHMLTVCLSCYKTCTIINNIQSS